MSRIRDLLNEIKWTKDLSQLEVWYLHRGAPHNIKIISGSMILSIDKSSFETATATISYHRIQRLVYNRAILYERS